MINKTLDDWWTSHHSLGGSVYKVNADWNLIHSPEDYVAELYEQFRQIDFNDILRFSEARTTNNRMNNREVLEDASKVFWLTQLAKDNQLSFVPQILHEPWFDRYRVHPGSGRLAAMWQAGITNFPAVYIHFGDEFTVPPNSEKIKNAVEFEKCIIYQNKTVPEYETYPASNCAKTHAMDSEWKYESDTPWRFIRWSEGRKFLQYKRQWRNTAIELWDSLTN